MSSLGQILTELSHGGLHESFEKWTKHSQFLASCCAAANELWHPHVQECVGIVPEPCRGGQNLGHPLNQGGMGCQGLFFGGGGAR